MPEKSEARAETVLELTSLIYDSVADVSRWQVFLEAFAHAIGARNGNLSLRDLNGYFGIVCWHGWRKVDPKLYKDYALIDPWRSGTEKWPEGAVGLDTDICPREEFKSSAVCRDFYAPNEAFHGIGGTILVSSSGQSVIVGTRGAEQGPFGEPEKAILRPLMPHLKRAVLLHGELGAMRSQLATFTDHLNRYPHAFLLADAECRIVYANAAAHEMAVLRDGITMEGGYLKIGSLQHKAAFSQAVSEVASGGITELRRLLIPRPSHKRPYRLILMPVGDSGALPLGVSLPAVSVLVIDAASQTEPDLSALCETFSFTPAEARVVGKLAVGRSAEEIAAELKISVETVRTHIKRSLSKAGAERQGELISLVLRSVPLGLSRNISSRTQFG